ncbi:MULTISPECIES: MFS transporter [Streptomyces]|uniref:MFS transporter n=1 Tax=Streptomyces tsukubensis (strain DSM 42081 / NBRC 108919 / NRRL 18488 / 9993) TaxID=1114943 RepID=I2N2D2_STRT9|nr:MULTISPECIES: MFS transporter [Streptomyces]AZK95306.1 MFS transporter [Streptomyces tsukubensis]EIF91179.1 major facilitator transporter [Streptomyces tsukubensis NRRL18488]MYS62947.1 MFS transporter [Streptomyces sp. SID5473]QKM68639.1 MFS transporter [Streptomyces tsukubensis NRRL18488]TAI43447.1 MFS transporter [Streptomyces tsukubensis]
MTAGAPGPDTSGDSSLWRHGDFLKLWFGETLSLVGAHVTNLALPLTAISAFQATDEQVGVLRFLQLVPYLGLALLFGVWVDRSRRRRLMIGANTVRMALLALVPLLHWLDALDMVTLMVIACAVGTASVLFDVSWMSYVPSLVRDPKRYVEAGAKLSAGASAADVAGPGVAGVLVAALTAPVALIVDAVSYLVSIVSLLLIRSREPRPAQPAERRQLRAELRDGLRWVFRNPVLRSLALIGFCCNFSMISVWTMFLLYGTGDLGLGPATIGGIFAAASLGGLTGAAISRRIIRRFPLGRVYLVSQSALLLGPVLVAVAAGPRPVMVGLFVLSFLTTYLGLGVAGVIIVSLRQISTPQELMGRMTASFRTLLFGGGALGGLAGGLLSGAIGARGALTVAAIGSAAVVVALFRSPVTRLTAMPSPAREPDTVR